MDRKQWLYITRPARAGMLTEGPTAAEQDSVSRHAAYHDELGNKGIDIMVGRTQVNTAETVGLCVFLAEDEASARKIMESDPAVADGVMTAELFPYRIAFGNADSFRTALEAAN